MITDEELAELERLQKEGSGVAMVAANRLLPELLSSYKAFKEENDKVGEENRELYAAIERLRKEHQESRDRAIKAEAENQDWCSNIGRMVVHFGREPHPTDYTETIAQMSTGLGILRYEHREALRELERTRNLCVAIESEVDRCRGWHPWDDSDFIPSGLEAEIHPNGVPQ